MKKMVWLFLGSALLLTFSTSVMAAGDWRVGKKLYKDECLSCHKRGGQAERLVVNEKSKAAWTKFFDSEKKGPHDALWKELSADQKEHLLKYFHKYAKDDKQVLGCG